MKKILFSVCMLCMAAVAMAQGDALKSKIVEDGGQGPYKAIMTEVPGLQAHTVFAPQDLSKFGKKNPLREGVRQVRTSWLSERPLSWLLYLRMGLWR